MRASFSSCTSLAGHCLHFDASRRIGLMSSHRYDWSGHFSDIRATLTSGAAAKDREHPTSHDSSPGHARRLGPWSAVLLLWMPLYALGMTAFLEGCNQAKLASVLRFPIQQPVNAAMNLALVMLLGWFCVG